MKKLLFTLLLIMAIGCGSPPTVEPIENYKGCVVIERFGYLFTPDVAVRLKSKDSIFWIGTVRYDAERFKEGDTIK